MKYITLIVLFMFNHWAHGQLDQNSVMVIPQATAAEITAITGASAGAFAYASDSEEFYFFNGSAWQVVQRNSSQTAYSGIIQITSTGAINVSGLPFSPRNITFVAHANVESLNLNADNAVGNNNTGLANSFGTTNGFARNDGGSVVQQTIYVGGSGNSINDISRYASSSHCLGIRYGNQNGNNLGLTTAQCTGFTADGFTLNVDNYSDGLVVLYTAYY